MDRMTDAERASLFFDDTSEWKDKRNYDLSDRIWKNKADLRRRIDETLRESIRTGRGVEETSTELERFINPTFAKPGDGQAHYSATRLARNETKRAHGLATRAVTQTDPAGGYMRYRLSRSRHIDPHDCDTFAEHNEGYGRGVWPAATCPIPNVDTHVGCNCYVERIPMAARGMGDFVEQLRVEYDLGDPPDLSPTDLVIFRRETAAIRSAVTFMFRAWLQQTGLVTPADLLETAPTVADWVSGVKRRKARRRG